MDTGVACETGPRAGETMETDVIHGYHVILPCYGCWLPNDPRGSWSEFVGCWELAMSGQTTRHLEQRTLAQLTADERTHRGAVQDALLYPPVVLNDHQVMSVADGFARQAEKSGYAIWACSILPEHTHLVIARHRYKVEQVTNLLKGAATRELMNDGCHPLQQHVGSGERPPHMWARHQWKVYLGTEKAIENAIAYVVDNPLKEGKPVQDWNWLTPFAGVDRGWQTYH